MVRRALCSRNARIQPVDALDQLFENTPRRSEISDSDAAKIWLGSHMHDVIASRSGRLDRQMSRSRRKQSK